MAIQTILEHNGGPITRKIDLYDIGRFEQFSRYRTFSDRKSVNHAELGVDILNRQSILDGLDQECRMAILQVISNHNRFVISPQDIPEIGFFSRLLRDADKLDIFRVVTTEYRQPSEKKNESVGLDLPDTNVISTKVIQSLRKRQLVDIKDIRSLNDFKLLQIGWVFDINFQPTFRVITDREYLSIIQSTLPLRTDLDEIFTEIHQYLQKRANGLPA